MSWDDIALVLGGTRRHGVPCWCQHFKIPDAQWHATAEEERAHRLRAQTDCGHPASGSTSGLVATVHGEPAAWCNVEPRSEFLALGRTPWSGRSEDEQDPTVWALTCFITRPGYRRGGLTYALTRAAVDFARDNGARVLEGYPMITEPGKDIPWGEVHVGSRNAFAAAGFTQVSHPSKRRVVMRMEL